MGITLDTLSSAFHSVQVKDAAGNTLTMDASGNVGIHDGGNSITVDAVDLDIRDLSASQDNVAISDGTDTLAVNADGSLNAVVSATALDIRALTNADVVTVEQGTSPWVIGDGGGSITVDGTVNTTPAGYSSWQTSQTSVTTSATQLAATPLAGRLNIIIQNLGNQDVYLKNANTVSTNDLLLPKGSSMEILLDDGASVYAITSTGTADIRVAEFAA